MAHSSVAPPGPSRNGVLAFVNFVLVDDIVLLGVRDRRRAAAVADARNRARIRT